MVRRIAKTPHQEPRRHGDDERLGDLIASFSPSGESGIAATALHNAQIVAMHACGLANRELGVRATECTVFKLGSISKHFIAAALLLLASDGVLRLDDYIAAYFTRAPLTWQKITVRQLLTHTAGLVREPAIFDAYLIQPLSRIVEEAFGQPLLFAPGDGFSYSNLGYFVLADLIRRITGQPFHQLISARIFRPAGMTTARTASVTDLIPNRANSYLQRDGQAFNAGDLIALRPSSAFVSSITDIAKWEQALHCGTVLDEKLSAQMIEPARLNDTTTHAYGLGWRLLNLEGHRIAFHGGGLWGFRTIMLRYVDDGFTVGVLANCVATDVHRLAIEIARLFAPGLPVLAESDLKRVAFGR